jgi:chemotaxis protein CheC
VIRRDQSHIFESTNPRQMPILFLHIQFAISLQEIQGYVALMMDIPSIDELRALLAVFIASVAR